MSFRSPKLGMPFYAGLGKPKYSVEFVLFSAEEEGLLGSKAYVCWPGSGVVKGSPLGVEKRVSASEAI